jgi:hypothetical protein
VVSPRLGGGIELSRLPVCKVRLRRWPRAHSGEWHGRGDSNELVPGSRGRGTGNRRNRAVAMQRQRRGADQCVSVVGMDNVRVAVGWNHHGSSSSPAPRSPRRRNGGGASSAQADVLIRGGARGQGCPPKCGPCYSRLSNSRACQLTTGTEAVGSTPPCRHAGAPSGGCSSTRGLYSTSWMRPSKVRCSIISRATSG